MEDRKIDRYSSASQQPNPYIGREVPLAPLPSNEASASNMLLYPTHELASLYCENRNVPVKQFEAKIFREVLYPHARFFRLPLLLFYPEIFASDREFIRQVGQAQSMVEYIEAENAFRRRITHFSEFRRAMKLRVSTRRIRRIVEGIFRN
jgi:hypothetical protein